MKKILFSLIFIAAFSALALSANSFIISSAQPDQIVPLVPTTVEEEIQASQLVVYGEVISVAEEQTREQKQSNTRIRTLIGNSVANVKVIETFKGGVAGDFISVVYAGSPARSYPPPVTFAAGEKCVLFLVYVSDGRFATLSATSGKEYPDEQLLSKLRRITGKTSGGKNGGVYAVLKAGAATGKEPVYVTLTIVNDTTGDFPVFSGVGVLSDIMVQGPDGKKLSPKQAGHRPAAGATQTVLLLPGHFIGARINLSALFDFTAGGTYNITARIPTPGAGNTERAATLVSNTVQITVGQKAP